MSPTSGPLGSNPLPSTPSEKVGDTKEILPVVNASDIKINSLDQLKDVLIQYLGKKKGTEMYNSWFSSWVATMMAPLRQSAAHAQQAAKQMSQDQS